jgi:calcium-dependent protein kinase
MGTCHSGIERQRSLQNIDKHKIDLPSKQLSYKKRKSIENINFMKEDFVVENTNNILKTYQIEAEPIDKGHFTEIRKAVHLKTGESRAIKLIKTHHNGAPTIEEVLHEISVIKALDHPYIIKIYEYFIAKTNFYIVMEFINGNPLFEYMFEKKVEINEKFIGDVMFKTLSALNHIHLKDFVHGYIQNKNILFDGNGVTLIDFSNSVSLANFLPLDMRKPEPSIWSSPELLDGDITDKADIWALGIVFYMLLTGIAPFVEDDTELMKAQIKKHQFARDINKLSEVSPIAIDLLSKMLTKDSKTRLTASECLKHEFFASCQKQVDPKAFDHVLGNIRHYTIKNKLQQAVYAYYLAAVLNNHEQQEIVEVFQAIDKNKDGQISKDELKQGLALAGRIYSSDEIDEIFNKIDTEKKGLITFREYFAAAIDKNMALNEDRLRKFFNHIDKVL